MGNGWVGKRGALIFKEREKYGLAGVKRADFGQGSTSAIDQGYFMSIQVRRWGFQVWLGLALMLPGVMAQAPVKWLSALPKPQEKLTVERAPGLYAPEEVAEARRNGIPGIPHLEWKIRSRGYPIGGGKAGREFFYIEVETGDLAPDYLLVFTVAGHVEEKDVLVRDTQGGQPGVVGIDLAKNMFTLAESDLVTIMLPTDFPETVAKAPIVYTVSTKKGEFGITLTPEMLQPVLAAVAEHNPWAARVEARQKLQHKLDDFRTGYVDKHPELSPEIKRAILQGKLAIGMPAAGVLLARGTATSKESDTSAAGTVEAWTYDLGGGKTETVYLENDVVTHWTQRQR